MKTVLAVSPHLDDAVFSAGGLLTEHVAAGDSVVIATVFTGSVPKPTAFALACQLDKGLGPDIDYMALRRAEDARSCAILGAGFVHMPFLEAPHRGYDSAVALFGPRLTEDEVLPEITSALAALVSEIAPDIVLGPRCIGDHVDHYIVREAIERLALRRTAYWDDWPYALKRAGAAAVKGEPLSESTLRAKLAACAAYESQIIFQFGSMAGLREAVLAHPFERLTLGRPSH